MSDEDNYKAELRKTPKRPTTSPYIRAVLGIPSYEDEEESLDRLMKSLEQKGLFDDDKLYRGTGQEELDLWKKNEGPIGIAQCAIGDAYDDIYDLGDALDLTHDEASGESADMTDRVCCYTHSDLLACDATDAVQANRGPLHWARENSTSPRLIVFNAAKMEQVGVFEYRPLPMLKHRKEAIAGVITIKVA